MPMTVETHVTGERTKLSLSGRFDFSAHREFRRSYEDVLRQPGVAILEIDLGGVDYIDSSALGVLVLLKKSAERAQLRLALTNYSDAIHRALDAAND